jgi:predicted  nucleic acid-binding Zn-ribbon protein
VSTAEHPGSEPPPSTLDLLAALESLVAESRRVPFTGTVAVNDDELLSLVDRIRLSIPGDLVSAQQLLDQRERVLSQTEEEVGELRARAEAAARNLAERTQDAARRAAEHTAEEASRLRGVAEAEARRIIEEARARAEEMVSEHTLLRAAEERGAALLRDAQASAARQAADAEEYMHQAEQYVAGVMAELEDHLSRVTATVRNGVGALHGRTAPHEAGKPAARRQR